MTFCQTCHAPEADPNRPSVPAAAAALGVGCVTCHLPAAGQGVLAPSAMTSGVEATPHVVLRDARFGEDGACASCHEFSFPGPSAARMPELMQSTIHEHRESPYAAVPCASCHMPQRDGPTRSHRDHRFAVAASPSMIAGSLQIVASRPAPTVARLILTPTAVGHAVPTGDLFRRLEVSVEPVDNTTTSLVTRRYLTRHFRDRFRPNGAVLRSVTSDDRPGGADTHGPVTVDLNVGPGGIGRQLAYRVTYQRVEHPRSDRAEDSVVESEVEIAHGVLP